MSATVPSSVALDQARELTALRAEVAALREEKRRAEADRDHTQRQADIGQLMLRTIRQGLQLPDEFSAQMVIDRAGRTEALVGKMGAALAEIKREQGVVCQNYELCRHEGCRSSYASWAIADAALANRVTP